jgi:hypothetical protein
MPHCAHSDRLAETRCVRVDRARGYGAAPAARRWRSRGCAVARLRGWTITLRAGSDPSARRQWRSCCRATTAQTRSHGTMRCARCKASCRSEGPPFSEQYCFGTASPRASVVRLESRVPSPAASTIAQFSHRALMGSLPRRAADTHRSCKRHREFLEAECGGNCHGCTSPHILAPTAAFPSIPSGESCCR